MITFTIKARQGYNVHQDFTFISYTLVKSLGTLQGIQLIPVAGMTSTWKCSDKINVSPLRPSILNQSWVSSSRKAEQLQSLPEVSQTPQHRRSHWLRIHTIPSQLSGLFFFALLHQVPHSQISTHQTSKSGEKMKKWFASSIICKSIQWRYFRSAM